MTKTRWRSRFSTRLSRLWPQALLPGKRLNPCQIILGGGIIEGMPEMVQRVENKGVRSRALSAATGRLAIQLPPKLGGEAGIIGAAALARQISK